MTTLKCPGAYLFVLVQFEDPVLKKIIKILLLFVYVSGLECIFFDSLSDLQTYFFNIARPLPLQKNNGPSLSTY